MVSAEASLELSLKWKSLSSESDVSAPVNGTNGIEYAPNITLLVVGKRHHVRFFPVNGPRYPAEAKKMKENLYSGLVVDTTVTSPMGCDFYLQSHNSALGTARSAHYIVLLNESKYFMEQLQELVRYIYFKVYKSNINFQTNNICYTGQRATESMSVCTPAKYADFLCARLRCYMKPWLGSTFTPDPKTGKTTVRTDTSFYEDDLDTWGRNLGATQIPANPGNKRKNPRHERCDNFMFYL